MLNKVKLGYPIMNSKNQEWGFYGTANDILRSNKKTDEIWNAASILIRDITECLKPIDIMNLLDSKWGRHMADRFYYEIQNETFITAFQKEFSKRELIQAYNDYVDENAYQLQKLTKKELFCLELAKLSKKYGIVIQSIGGVSQNTSGFIRYNNDLDSGDLIPMYQGDE